MKRNPLFPLLLAAVALVTGCTSYQYRIVKPVTGAQVVTGRQVTVAGQPVTVPYDPLEYRLARRSDRLAMEIFNPTENRIVLLGDSSYAIDPKGESHPLRSLVIGPNSFARLLLPPQPIMVPYYGWGWGPWPYYDPYYYPNAPAYYSIPTPYDWTWKTGLARLELAYERDGQIFNHYFEIIREPQK